jgi:hypothetical protein
MSLATGVVLFWLLVLIAIRVALGDPALPF